MKLKRLAAIAAVIVVILVSGLIIGLTVSPQRGVYSGGNLPIPMPTPTPIPTPAPAGFEKGTPTVSAELELVGRKIVYNAWVSLEVKNVDVAIAQLKGTAEEVGGYVSNMVVSKGTDIKTGSITLRVPQDEFFNVIDKVERIGEVKDKNVNSEDVTQQYIDLTARLENAQREEKILLDLMSKAAEVKDMLEIETELARVREQIELYTGQLNFLESRIEYASISVALSEPTPPAPLPKVDWYATMMNGMHWLLLIVQGLIMLAFAIIPPVVIGVPVYYLYRRRSRRKQSAS